MLRAFRSSFALAAALCLAGPASAVDFGLDFVRDASSGDDLLTFTVFLEEQTTITGYELTVQYDASELEWITSNDLLPGLQATPQPGTAAHKPGGLKASALAFVPVVATDLFSIEFLVIGAVDDAAFDDFRVFLAPAGCELLPEGCVRIPPDCDTSASPGCDQIGSNGSGLSEFPGDPAAAITNLGFQVEVGLEGTQVMALAVPEPAALALLAPGLLAAALARRQR